MGSVDIIGAHSHQRQLEATPVRADHHLCRSFARRVWIRRRKYACLTEVCRANWYIPIHLVRRNVYEAIHTMLSCSLKQDVCAVDICTRELVRVAKAQVHVRLRREVEDGVDLVLAQHPLDVARTCDVALLKGKVGSAVEHPRVVQRRAIVELVKRHDVVVRIPKDQMADEPAGAVAALAIHCRPLGKLPQSPQPS